MTSDPSIDPNSVPVGEQPPLRKRVKKGAKRLRRRLLGQSRPYQTKRVDGTEKRWEMIAANLTQQDRSLLDVGCNVGVLTRRAADAGRLALGVDIEANLIRKAKLRHRNVPNLSFMCLGMSPETIQMLPEFDVTLCLSVHHHLARRYGLETSWEMLAALIAKTHHRFFFEPASIRKKYKDSAPDIVDLDRASIIDTTVQRLSDAVADEGTVRYLGETPCIGLEPFRLLFLVERR